MPEDYSWKVKLDWLNIISSLGLSSIDEIPEYKREKAIKKIHKLYDIDTLLTMEPAELERIVSNELKETMKKELMLKAKEDEKIKKEIQSKFVPFKNGGIIRINPQDLKDLGIDFNGDPEEFIKKFLKRFSGEDDDDRDDDKDKYKEDNTGYYI